MYCREAPQLTFPGWCGRHPAAAGQPSGERGPAQGAWRNWPRCTGPIAGKLKPLGGTLLQEPVSAGTGVGRLALPNVRDRGLARLPGQCTRSRFDRHRGGGHPPTPATPPCVRVRTRRFETVTLTFLEQRRKSQRFEVCLGKPYVEGLGEREIRGATATASHIGRQLWTHPQLKQCRPTTAGCFPLPP